MTTIAQHIQVEERDTAAVERRRFPFPYRAMMAICSDLDETPNRHVYWETTRYLNTTQQTAMGPGVGLEVGNTMYFDMPPDQFAYWNTDGAGRDMIRALIHSGHIDCFHSFGDLATTRKDAERALDELSRHRCRLEVWIDHGVAPSNFGPDIMRGQGDLPGTEVFHADLTYDYGVRYVWRGRVTSVIGQDVPRQLDGIGTMSHPLVSSRTVAKEFVKGVLARFGSQKYEIHAANQVVRETQLRSGHSVWEFLRANPHWGGVSRGETADGLAEVLVEPMLDRLVARGGVSILYTHLGKIREHDAPLNPRTRESLHRLARYMRDGRLLVTTTHRLLTYCRMLREARITATQSSDGLVIEVRTPEGTGGYDLVQGLCLYVPHPEHVRLVVNGQERRDVVSNPADETGRSSLSVEWRPLTFPSWDPE